LIVNFLLKLFSTQLNNKNNKSNVDLKNQKSMMSSLSHGSSFFFIGTHIIICIPRLSSINASLTVILLIIRFVCAIILYFSLFITFVVFGIPNTSITFKACLAIFLLISFIFNNFADSFGFSSSSMRTTSKSIERD